MRFTKFIIYFFTCFCQTLLANTSVCPDGKYPVQGHFRTDYYRSDGTHVNATDVNRYCREYRPQKPLVIVFSNLAPKGWPHKNENFRNWTEKEKNEVQKALNELPALLTQIGDVKFYRAVKSESIDNPATNAPAEKMIVLYDNISKYDLKRVIAHELSHLYYVSMPYSEKNSYHEVAKWIKIENSFSTTRTIFTAPDGLMSPEEDFSNNFEYYLFEKKSLDKEPLIYDWIKKTMGDK